MNLPAIPDVGLPAVLQNLGWTRESEVPDRFVVWAKGDSEVLVPVNPRRTDYQSLMERAQAVVERIEGYRGRVEIERMRSVARGFDISRFSRATEIEGGAIQWEQGRAIFAAAERSLVAAVRSAKEPRRYHGTSSGYLVRNFLRSALMGQTEVGSFVVTALIPAREKFYLRKAEEPQDGMLPFDGTLSGRTIMETFETAIESTRAALDEYANTFRRLVIPDEPLQVFDDLVQSGVSSELLSSLSTITTGTSEAAVIIEMTNIDSRARQTQAVFRGSESDVLSRVADRFLQDPEPELLTIEGGITLLERPRPRQAGVIRIQTGRSAHSRKVRLEIEADQYNEIIEAFRDGFRMRARGEVSREGQRYWMRRPQSFEFIPPLEPGDVSPLVDPDGEDPPDLTLWSDEDTEHDEA